MFPRASEADKIRQDREHSSTPSPRWNRRDATFPDLGDRSQTRGTFGIFYTLLGHERFSVTEWR